MAIFLWDDHGSREFTEAVKLSGVPMQEVFSAENLADKMSPDSLLIMNQSLEARRPAVRMLITARIPFALFGLPGPDEESREQLARRLKKRHVRACWLGSLRFLPGVFRLKELINSGVFGEIRSVQISGTDMAENSFEFFRRGDLLRWLLAGTAPLPEISWLPSGNSEYFFRLQGSTGRADWHCSPETEAELLWQMGEKHKKQSFHYENSIVRELQLLNVCFLNCWTWNGLAGILPEK